MRQRSRKKQSQGQLEETNNHLNHKEVRNSKRWINQTPVLTFSQSPSPAHSQCGVNFQLKISSKGSAGWQRQHMGESNRGRRQFDCMLEYNLVWHVVYILTSIAAFVKLCYSEQSAGRIKKEFPHPNVSYFHTEFIAFDHYSLLTLIIVCPLIVCAIIIYFKIGV